MGLICVMDPSRADIPAAIKACQDAGIRVVMVTGDQAGTALHVAKNTGICQTEGEQCIALGKEIDEAQRQGRLNDMLGVTVFSRVTPQNKLDIIQMHQDEGAVVAMTGDGVNDAPALKKPTSALPWVSEARKWHERRPTWCCVMMPLFLSFLLSSRAG